MKFLLFKILLLKRARDEGFTLPMVIAIGLIMILLSGVNLVQSSEEKLNAISQNSSSNALAVAELGIARYRELLNNNRVLAVYNLDQWNAQSGETCDAVTDGTGDWADDSSWRDLSLNETTFTVDFNDDGDTTDTSADIGEYKIVNYQYDRDGDLATDENGVLDLSSDEANDTDGDSESDARGILTVQGRTPNQGAIAQLQVEIPIGVNPNDLISLNPGIWVHQPTIANVGTITLTTGNLVVYRASSGSDKCANVTLGGLTAIRDARDLPPIVDINSITNVRELQGDISTENSSTDVNYFNGGQILLGTLLDKDDTGGTIALNTIDGTDRYYYKTASNTTLSIGDGESILADGTAKVILYVGGDLDITTGASDVNLGNSSGVATSRYLEIHVNGNVNISGTGQLNLTGLIHAPNGSVNISGSASVNVTGSIWANDWSNTSSGAVTVTTDDYKFYSLTSQRTPKPLTYRPTKWEQQEAQ